MTNRLPASLILPLRLFVALGLLIPLQAAFAQETTPQPQTANAADEPAVSVVEEVSAGTVQSAVPLADSGFWFLSTQHSPQSFHRNCPQFCPSVSRYEDGLGYNPSSFADMTASLEPGVPVCIVVHGSFVDTANACRESVCAWNWLRSASQGHRMQMISFSWPSYRPLTPLVAMDVNALGHRAARNGYYLADLLQHIPPECPVCLMGHSHGTRVVASALHLMAGGVVEGIYHPTSRVNGRHIRTVFAAAAIDHNWLNPGKRYGRALCSTQCVLNLHNPADPALQIYPLRLPLIAKKPLGLHGLSNWDRRRLGGYANKIVNYNVQRYVGRHHLWPHFFCNTGLAMVVHNYVYFPDHQPPAGHLPPGR